MNAQDLKNSILQLAIQGKLVEQREEEGTAKELLEKIEVEKKQLIKEGKIKKQKALPAIIEDEIPFDIPESWEWVRFGEMVNFNMGKTPPRSELKYWKDDYSWVSIADMIADGYILETKEKISEIALNEKFKMSLVPKGTLLMSFKLTVGKVSILDIDAVHNEAIISIYPYADLEESIRNYLFVMLPLLSTYGETKGAIKGKTLNSTSLNNLLIPLPPLEEQKRIVAKIEELKPYVDKYDVAYSEVEELNKKFPEDMQKSILQYAIQGKLVEQREEDGTAEDLYKQIQEEKKKLIKEGKIKKTKALPEITEDEIPFDIPENWKWVRLGEVAIKITDGSHNPPPKKSSGYYVISAKNVKNGKIIFDNVDRYTDEEGFLKENSRTNIKRGDIIMGIIGGSIGNIAIYNHDEKVIAQRSIAIIDTLANNEFIKVILQSPLIQHQLKNTSSTAQGGVYLGTINEILIPFPPLEEQKRIVKKIEELFPYTLQLVK
jgi:type I restriction enzyme S subunit